MVGTFIAQFAGRCAACGEGFGPGRPCAYDEDNEVITQDCEGPTDAMALGPQDIAKLRHKACPICFCIHNGECA